MTNNKPVFLSLPILLSLLLALGACSDIPSSFGQYHRGKTLDVNVVTMERVPELIYSVGGPQQERRYFRIGTSSEGMELVMFRVKVENHLATSAIVNIDTQAAELRGFLRDSYRPIDINERAEEVSAPENPGVVRSIVFLWNATQEDGTPEAFNLRKDFGLDGWLLFEAPKDTKFREFRWRAGDSLTIDF